MTLRALVPALLGPGICFSPSWAHHVGLCETLNLPEVEFPVLLLQKSEECEKKGTGGLLVVVRVYLH